MWGRINNAGSNAYKYNLLSESTDADLISIVETNVLGVMLCCKEVGSISGRFQLRSLCAWKEELVVLSGRVHCFYSAASLRLMCVPHR